MNLESALKKEHSKSQCDRIVRYIGNDKLRFGELMKLFFSGEYRIIQRAAWPMSYCIRNYPALARPYLTRFLDKLESSDAHPAARRNIVRLLQYVEIPKRFQGRLMNRCFQFIEDPGEAIAVKAFSLKILENLAALYPEIIPELKQIIESRWDQETVAFRSRGRHILKKIAARS
jgi:hypothetical protein